MSLTHSKYLTLILEENFDLTITKAVEPLIYHGPLTLRNIALKTAVPFKVVKECLQVLIQHNIVYFSPRPNSSDILYRIEPDGVMSLLNYAGYCKRVEDKMDKEPKALFSAILRTGRISASKLLFLLGTLQVQKGITTPDQMSEIIKKDFDMFEKLVNHKYLTRADKLVSLASAEVPKFESYDFDDNAFKIPKIDLATICNAVMKGDVKITAVTNEDDDILWKVNTAQFECETKEDILGKAMGQRMRDPNIGSIFKVILSNGFSKNPNSDITPTTTFLEIKQAVTNLQNGEVLVQQLEETLKILAMDPLGVVNKTGEQHGGSYSVNVKEAIRLVTIATVEKIVESRFGPTTARLFRLVRRLGYSDQDKLTQKAMMSSKLGRSLLYKLVEAHFITLKEIRKTYTIASSLTNKLLAFVFYVDFDTVLRSLLEEAYQASINARMRLQTERKRHKRLLDKEQKIEKILFNMKKSSCTTEQVEEVTEMLTYPERKILARVYNRHHKLISAILHANRTIFIINSYFLYHQ